jgi:hypothetical protein
MKTKSGFPPNIQQLKTFFDVETHKPIFTYGDEIYAPYHEHVPEDIIEHEKIHIKQQKQFTNPDIWWNKYILDTEFRLAQELEAYAHQYQWIKGISNTKIADEALIEMASNLSSPLYRLNISYGRAEKLIKKYGKDKS